MTIAQNKDLKRPWIGNFKLRQEVVNIWIFVFHCTDWEASANSLYYWLIFLSRSIIKMRKNWQFTAFLNPYNCPGKIKTFVSILLFSIAPIFLSIELVEFVGKCILEEIFQWIECKEVENLAFKDVNVDQLSDVLSTSTEDLINKGFTIFQAVHDFYKGTIHILRKLLYSKNFNLLIKNFFSRIRFFRQNKKEFFFNIKFWRNFHAAVLKFLIQ